MIKLFFLGLISVIQGKEPEIIFPPLLDYTRLSFSCLRQNKIVAVHNATSHKIELNFVDMSKVVSSDKPCEGAYTISIDGKQMVYANGIIVALRKVDTLWCWSEGSILKFCGRPYKRGCDGILVSEIRSHQAAMDVFFNNKNDSYVALPTGTARFTGIIRVDP